MKRRSGAVSAEDEAFFRQVLRDAKPLKNRKAEAPPVGVHRNPFVAVPVHRPPLLIRESDLSVPAISGHAEARLRRGRMEPESRIDLHGHSYERAYRSLVSFLIHAYADGKRLVLVVTGKGGVLRTHLPAWLNGPELQQLVIGIREAHAKHGGGGAFYVALQRRKPAWRPR
jgi:DNA-nicking Smr family endonuclease